MRLLGYYFNALEIGARYYQIVFEMISLLGIILLGLGMIVTLRRIVSYVVLFKRELVQLELTLPQDSTQLPGATEQFFLALHGLSTSRSLVMRMVGLKSYSSFEIVSNRAGGIRFLVHCEITKAEAIEKLINSYANDIKIVRLKDLDKFASDKRSRIFEFKQDKHFAYPLKNYSGVKASDPISYLLSAMTKLQKDELMIYQLLISPIQMRTVMSIKRKIMVNGDLNQLLARRRSSKIQGLGVLVGKLGFILSDLISNLWVTRSGNMSRVGYGSSEAIYKKQVAQGIRPERSLSSFEQELLEAVHSKLTEALYRVEIRVMIRVKGGRREIKKRKEAINSALNVYAVEQQQRLVLRRRTYLAKSWLKEIEFRQRIPSFWDKPKNILSISEVAGLYHIPHSMTAKTENIVRSMSKTLPAPISLKNGSMLDILIGINSHHGEAVPIGLQKDERERHVYVIGGTGNGKTTMLLYMIVQDIRNGKGVAVVDPHGDLAETILRYVPKERIDDVVYFNPDDLAHPIGLNLLEMPLGLEGDELLREKDLITESVISIFRKIFSEDDSGGHRIEYILRNTIQTALTTERPTLFTIFRLLNDSVYCNEIVRRLEDEDLKNFWKNEINKAGDYQKVKMAAGITSKIGRFLFSASARRVLEQESSTIDFEDILNSSKILICNFSKGLIGEDTSSLFGTMVLAKLQIAALRRARLKESERGSFYLYVDEFQNFATMSFVQMLSEARKYKLFLIMAQQSTSQQDKQRLVDIILANVGTVVSFRSGSPADEKYILPLFSPFIRQGEIANLPTYNFYLRIAAVVAQEPLSGQTIILHDDGDEDIAQEVINSSRQKYGQWKRIKSIPKGKGELNNTSPRSNKPW